MMLEQLRQRLRALEKPASLRATGLLAARHRAASTRRSAAASLAARCTRSRRRARRISRRRPVSRWGCGGAKRARVCWIAEDMALAESGALYGGGLDALRPCARTPAHRRRRAPPRSLVGDGGGAALPRSRRRDRRMAPRRDRRGGGAAAVACRGARAARWRLCCAPRPRPMPPPPPRAGSSARRRRRRRCTGQARPRFAAQLIRNRRGPLGSWILQWSDSDERFLPRACSACGSADSRPTASSEHAARRLKRRSPSTASAAMPS